jgi:hypothetical protein
LQSLLTTPERGLSAAQYRAYNLVCDAIFFSGAALRYLNKLLFKQIKFVALGAQQCDAFSHCSRQRARKKEIYFCSSSALSRCLWDSPLADEKNHIFSSALYGVT